MPVPERRQWDAYQSWVWSFPGWEGSVRRFVRECRALGLTKFDVRAERTTIKIQAMRPDAVWEPVA
jgi:hypothetical protein